MSQRSRSWCFTLNNPPNGTSHPIPQFDNQRFRVYQLEQGTQETPHLQGYVYYEFNRSFKQVKKDLPAAHWEQAKGSTDQNVAYCTKEDGRLDGPWTEGEKPSQGSRTDLATAAELAKKRKFKEIDPTLYIKYHRGIQAYSLLSMSPRTDKPTVYWLYGKTGTGKSKLALELGDIHQTDVYFKPAGQWWDGYYQQGIVVIDDIRNEDYPFSMLLRILDRYPMQAPVKGGFVPINSNIIVITCPDTPEWCYQTNDVDHVSQLHRRISIQLELT